MRQIGLIVGWAIAVFCVLLLAWRFDFRDRKPFAYVDTDAHKSGDKQVIACDLGNKILDGGYAQEFRVSSSKITEHGIVDDSISFFRVKIQERAK